MIFTQTVQFGPGPTDYNGATGATSPGPSPTFTYFNSNLGTLNSVIFSSSYAFSSAISVTDSSNSGASGNVRTQSGAQFSSNASGITQALNAYVNNFVDPGGDGNSVTFGSSTLSPIAYDIRGSRSNYTLSPGQTLNFTSNGSASMSPVGDSTAADLAAFSRAGGGTYTPLFSTLTGLVISNSGGNVTASQTTSATGTLTISYDYTAAAVPEAATWALMLVGFGAVGAGMRSGRTRRTSLFA